MKICITGGAGFIGSHLADALLKRGDEVVIVDNLATGYLSNLESIRDQIEFHEGTCGDTDLMDKILQGVDGILHQAALTSVPRSMDNPMQTHAETMTAMAVTLDCARRTGIKRFVFAASSSTYGDQPGTYKQEDMYPLPKSPYAAAKTATEFYAAAWARAFGLECIGLRYFNVFGPRQDPDSTYAAVIPKFIRAVLSNQAPVITGDGDQSRDFTYVDNVVAANLKALDAPTPPEGCIVNIACGGAVTLPELVSTLNTIAGTSLDPIFTDARPGDVRHSLADITRAKELIDYEPVATFKEGLQHTLDYAREHWSL